MCCPHSETIFYVSCSINSLTPFSHTSGRTARPDSVQGMAFSILTISIKDFTSIWVPIPYSLLQPISRSYNGNYQRPMVKQRVTEHLFNSALNRLWQLLMAKHPAEIFGFPIEVTSTEAQNTRDDHWCPIVDQICYKQSRLIDYPMGVCSVQYNSKPSLMRCQLEFHISSNSFGT